jgi:hypothetical protein
MLIAWCVGVTLGQTMATGWQNGRSRSEMSCAREVEALPARLRYFAERCHKVEAPLLALNELGRFSVMMPLMWPVLGRPGQRVGPVALCDVIVMSGKRVLLTEAAILPG